MVKGKTSTGFEYEINERITTDWRFIKAIAGSSSKDDAKKLAAYADLATLLLGEDGEERLSRHCMEEDGIIPSDRISSEIAEILNSIVENQKK